MGEHRTTQRDRDEFIGIMVREGVPVNVVRIVMRHGARLHKLAVAQCNGDWPADNGERTVAECSQCQGMWAPITLKHAGHVGYGLGPMCPDCRTSRALTKLLEPFGIVPIFGGDPRGTVVVLKVPSGYTNDWGKEGVCVP